jgi:hypothetical protein
MKTLAFFGIALWAMTGISQTRTLNVRDFEGLATRINEQLAGGGWQMTNDGCRSITLVRPKTRLLFDYNLGLPGMPEEQKWQEHSTERDYTLRIDFDTELSQQEYDLLQTTRAKLVAGRVKGLDPSSVAYVQAKAAAEGLLRLPQYHWNGRSVYMSYPDGGLQTRPSSVADQCAKVKTLLDRTFTKYEASKSEPNAAPNAPPAHR